MSGVSEHFERLICRRIDGELSDEDRLALDRELLRNPAARDLLDRYSAADEIAGEVLHELAATGTGVHQQTTDIASSIPAAGIP
jgi:anti-sigma factor RsiW